MRMTMVMVAMIVSVIVSVAMVSMAKCRETHNVDYEAQCADYQ